MSHSSQLPRDAVGTSDDAEADPPIGTSSSTHHPTVTADKGKAKASERDSKTYRSVSPLRLRCVRGQSCSHHAELGTAVLRATPGRSVSHKVQRAGEGVVIDWIEARWGKIADVSQKTLNPPD